MSEQVNETNLRGSLDLLKYENACIVSVAGKTATKRGVFIPIEENDVYIKADDNLKAKSAYVGLLINARREVSQFGKTHYAKQSISKQFREANPELAEKRNGIYLGDFETYVFEGGNAANKVEVTAAAVPEDEKDDLPF